MVYEKLTEGHFSVSLTKYAPKANDISSKKKILAEVIPDLLEVNVLREKHWGSVEKFLNLDDRLSSLFDLGSFIRTMAL